MDAPNPKRLCPVPSITSSSENHIAPSFNQSEVDLTISSFLSLSDLPLFSTPLSIDCSFDRVLDKVITSAAAGNSGDEFDQDRFLDRTLQLASLLCESTKRRIRNRATLHNSISWPIPHELTIKVFSMLDTKSLMQASACCTMLKNCAKDSVCYSHVDLTMAAKPVDDGVVKIMIHRAGEELRSLKLGCISPPAGSTSLLKTSCLTPLSSNGGFARGLLRSLHLYNLELRDRKSLCAVLSACSNLTDLKIVVSASGERINAIKQLALLTRNCRLLEQLHLETSSSVALKTTTTNSELVEFVDNHPNLTSLSLLHFKVDDEIAQIIIKGFPQLKHLNLSRTTEIHGYFLRCEELRDSSLETLILRNCYGLKQREVSLFMKFLTAGDFESIRYIDVSNGYGVATTGSRRTFDPNYPIEKLKKQRPDVTVVATFQPTSPPSSSGVRHWVNNYSRNYSSEEYSSDDDFDE